MARQFLRQKTEDLETAGREFAQVGTNLTFRGLLVAVTEFGGKLAPLMKMHVLTREQRLPLGLGAAWEFFSSPRNLDAITPPELGFKIVDLREETMHEGQIIVYRVKVAPWVWVPWVTEIKSVREGFAFVDEQRFGPYKFWHHRHSFESCDGGVLMRDVVHYRLPLGPLGDLAHALFVRRKLERIFDFRREILERRFGRWRGTGEGLAGAGH